MRNFVRIIGVPGLANLGVVQAGAIYRSAQPEIYEALGQYLGVKVVLCLRDDSDQQMADRTAEVILAGMRYIPFRINVFSDLTSEDLDFLVRVMLDPVNHPMLVSCQHGKNRTGVAIAKYRLAVDHWSMKEALEEMAAYGGDTLLDIFLRRCLDRDTEALGI